MSPLDVLVIIPCLNEEEHIEKLLLQLISESPKLIVVADGGSSDKTVEIVNQCIKNYPSIKLINNNKKIQSAAINLVVEEFGAEFKYFIRVDAHGEYPDHFLETLFKEATNLEADSIVISMDTFGKSGFQKAAACAQNSKLGNGGSAHRNNSDGEWVMHGHHALMSIDAFEKVGGYDESFIANEDAELDYRLTSSGYKIWLTGKTKMKYFPRGSFYSLFVQYYRYGVGRASNALKHKEIPKLRQLLPLSVFPCSLIFFLTHISYLFSVPFIGWLGLCLIYGGLLSLKSRSLTNLLSGPVAAIMHYGWSLGFCNKLIKHTFYSAVGKSSWSK